VSGQFHTPAHLSPGKSPRYPLDRRLGVPQNRFGRRGIEKILDSNSDPSVVQPVTSRYINNAIPAPASLDRFWDCIWSLPSSSFPVHHSFNPTIQRYSPLAQTQLLTCSRTVMGVQACLSVRDEGPYPARTVQFCHPCTIMCPPYQYSRSLLRYDHRKSVRDISGNTI
jgi:hypothetical protein